jgi:hypothetical protein
VLGNIGDLRPDNETALVTEIIEILVVLIVSKTNGGCANLANEVDIFLVMLGKKRVTYTPSVLVTGYAAEGIFLAVENEAAIGIDFERTAAEAVANVVKNLTVFYDFNLAAVEVGVASAVPEMHVLKLEIHNAVGALLADKLRAIRIVYSVLDRRALCGMPVLDLDIGIGAVYGRSYGNSRTSEIFKIEVVLVYADKVYVTVKTAVEGKVRHLGINLFVRRVVNGYKEDVLIRKRVGKLYPEGGITAVVVSKLLAVKIYIGRGVCALDLKIIFVRHGKSRLGERSRVISHTAEVVVAAVLTVDRVPGVRKRDMLALGQLSEVFNLFLGEYPLAVYVYNVSHKNVPFNFCNLGITIHCKQL